MTLVTQGAWIVCVLLFTGCQLVFELDAPCSETTDEDCDRIANADDSCPSDIDISTDGDGDDVDDVCDPNPIAGDALVLFDGFNDAGTWTIASGAWLFENGGLIEASDGEATISLVVSPVQRLTIVLVVDDLDLGVDGVVAGFAEASGLPGGCEVAQTPEGLVLRAAGGVVVAPLAGEGTLRLTGGQLPTDETYCRARFGDAADVQLTAPFGLGTIVIDTLGLTTRNASARFRSLTVFSGLP